MGPDAAIGFSSHNYQLCAAGGEPVDYVALGPVFSHCSKGTPIPLSASKKSAAAGRCSISHWSQSAQLRRRTRFQVLHAGADSVSGDRGLLPDTLRRKRCGNGWSNGNILQAPCSRTRPDADYNTLPTMLSLLCCASTFSRAQAGSRPMKKAIV